MGSNITADIKHVLLEIIYLLQKKTVCWKIVIQFNPLSANPTKWPNILNNSSAIC